MSKCWCELNGTAGINNCSKHINMHHMQPLTISHILLTLSRLFSEGCIESGGWWRFCVIYIHMCSSTRPHPKQSCCFSPRSLKHTSVASSINDSMQSQRHVTFVHLLERPTDIVCQIFPISLVQFA